METIIKEVLLMKKEDEIKEYKAQLEKELALKIARACVGYRENITNTIKNLKGQIKALDWVLQEVINETK